MTSSESHIYGSPLFWHFTDIDRQVFEEYATQEEVFDHAIADIPISLLEGFNCTCIAYGQTGTGKTHTMLGADWGAHGLMHKSSRLLKVDGPRAGTSMGNFSDEGGNASGRIEVMSEKEDGGSESEGMISRTISSLFALIKKVKPTTEFTIRVSYVEIYLEKILDLLHPQGSGGSITIEEDQEADRAAGSCSSVRIKGASELCCFDEADVCALLTRGNACRTMSSTEMNTESSRSHAIFVLRLQQRDTLTGKVRSSVLHMVDLAGSELGSREASKRSSVAANVSAVHSEALMINKSLSALNKMIRAQLAHQGGEPNVPVDEIARQSKLSRLIRPSFGGNCLTTLILTASPSSYNIGETISSINFGQRCRRIFNEPIQNVEEETPEYFRKQLKDTKVQYEDAMALVRALAGECLRMKDGESTGTGPLWDTIAYLGRKHDPPVNFKVTIVKQPAGEGEGGDADIQFFANEQVQLQDQVEGLKEELENMSRQRLDAEGHLAEVHSEVAVLRTQNENLTSDKKRNVEELVNAKNEVQVLSQRKLEVEHNLRTSQFRENEAIVFLRQFRRFYRNVLKDKAAHGAGSIAAITSEVTKKVPNAPDLGELHDIDRLLLESGLLEDYEVDSDKASNSYLPSKDALMRSAAAAQRAAAVDAELATEDTDDETHAPYAADSIARLAGPLRLPGPDVLMPSGVEAAGALYRSRSEESGDEEVALAGGADAGADAGAGTQHYDEKSYLSNDSISLAHSIARVPATGVLMARRQRMLKTPAGILTAMREKDVEKELLEMSERCIDLQMALNEEKAVVDALTNKSGGLGKKRVAQETISLRQQLEKKTASLTAIAWKMNELNLINKTFNEKMANRELHVMYLEEQLVDLQNSNLKLIVDTAENERKLRDEIENLHRVVGGMTVPLWQFGEKSIGDKPLASRIIITSAGGLLANEIDQTQRRRSIGEQEPDMEFPEFRDFPSGDLPTFRSSDSEDSVDADVILSDIPHVGVPEGAVANPKRPKRRPSDRLRSTVSKLKILSSLSRAANSTTGETEASKSVKESRHLGAIPPAILVQGIADNRSPAINPLSVVVETHEAETHEAETQTEPEEKTVHMDNSSQTYEVQIFEVGVPVIVDDGGPECVNANVQTDDVQVFEYDANVKLDLQTETRDDEAQTDEIQMFEIGVPIALNPQLDTFDAEAQTDQIACSRAGVQTEEAPVITTHEHDDVVNDTMLNDDAIQGGLPECPDQTRNVDFGTMETSTVVGTKGNISELQASQSDALGTVGGHSDDTLTPESPAGEHFSDSSHGESTGSLQDDDDVSNVSRGVGIDDDDDASEHSDAASDSEFEGFDLRPGSSASAPHSSFESRVKIDSPIFVDEDTTDKDVAEQGRDGDEDDLYKEEERSSDDLPVGLNQEELGCSHPFEGNVDGDEYSISLNLIPRCEQTDNTLVETLDQDICDTDAPETKERSESEEAKHPSSAETSSVHDWQEIGVYGSDESYVAPAVVALGEPDSAPLNDLTHGGPMLPIALSDRGESPNEGEGTAPEASIDSGDCPPLVEKDHTGDNFPLSSFTNIDAPKSPISRFMPAGPATRPGSSRFMPQTDAPRHTNRGARRLMLDNNIAPNSASRRNPTTPGLPSTPDSFEQLDEGAGYDELGLRWGLTDDEIAADAAVLKTHHDESQTPGESEVVGKADEEDHEDFDDESPPHSPSSIDGEERNLFDNDFAERRSSHSTDFGSSHGSDDGVGRARRLPFRKMSEADDIVLVNEPEDDVHDDEFEKLMGETVAALAAADEPPVVDFGETIFDGSAVFEEAGLPSHDKKVMPGSVQDSGFIEEGVHEETEDVEPLIEAIGFDTILLAGSMSGDASEHRSVPDMDVEIQPVTPFRTPRINNEVAMSAASLIDSPRKRDPRATSRRHDEKKKRKSRQSSRSPAPRPPRPERGEDDANERRRRHKSKTRRRDERANDDKRRSRSHRRTADDERVDFRDEAGSRSSRNLMGDGNEVSQRVDKRSHRNNGHTDEASLESPRLLSGKLADSADFEKEVRRRASVSLADSGEFGPESRPRRRSSRLPDIADGSRQKIELRDRLERHRSTRVHRHKRTDDVVVENEGLDVDSERRHRSSRHSVGGEVGEGANVRRHRSTRRGDGGDEEGGGQGERRRHKSASRASGGDDSTDATRAEVRRRKSRLSNVDPGVGDPPPTEHGDGLDGSRAGERKQRSGSRHRRDGAVSSEAATEERDRRGDEERRRRKHQAPSRRSSARRGD